MDKGAMKEPVTSTPAWDELEEWTSGRIIQEWMQQLLEEEVTEFLGARQASASRGGHAVDLAGRVAFAVPDGERGGGDVVVGELERDRF